MHTHTRRAQGLALLEALNGHLAAAELAAIAVGCGSRRLASDAELAPLCRACAGWLQEPAAVGPLLLAHRELVEAMARVRDADDKWRPAAVGFLVLARRQHVRAVRALADKLRLAGGL